MASGLTAAVPRRRFGNTGQSISKLCLGGGSFMGADSQALLDEALKNGVDCWEIVSFSGNAYRDYFTKNPGVRERVFLSGKVYSTDPAIMQQHLDDTLESNGVSSIDFLAVHAIDNVETLTDDVRQWADKAKRDKKIRFFGFCTHRNMDKCLNAAADLGWIDGIQTVYNYRLQGIGSLEDALQKCYVKGVGIFAVKAMGLCVMRESELQELPLNEARLNFLLASHEISFAQAKLKAIWQNPHLTSICSLMPTLAIIRANVSAAIDEHPLNADTKKLLADYAKSTGRYFCSRCGMCDATSADRIPIFSIMELLMYSRRYGMSKTWLAKKFSQIPSDIRNKITRSDYSSAESMCPQRMPITQLMKDAYMELNAYPS